MCKIYDFFFSKRNLFKVRNFLNHIETNDIKKRSFSFLHVLRMKAHEVVSIIQSISEIAEAYILGFQFLFFYLCFLRLLYKGL